MFEHQADIARSGTERVAEAKPARPERPNDAPAAILLAGGVEASPLAAAAGRSVLDLNIAPSRTVLGAWERAFKSVGISTVGVAEGGAAPSPLRHGGRVRTLRDAEPYRGPGGAARDAWEQLGRPNRVVIAEGGRWPGVSLPTILDAHERTQADVTVGVNPDGSPAGVYVASSSAVDLIPRLGFVDLKEQWLPHALGAGFDVRGHLLNGHGTRPIRTLPQLLSVATLAGEAKSAGTWRVICPGARVMRESDVVDSIVMPGAVIERGAVVARSLVLPGGRVGAGEILVDGVARADGRFVAFGDRPTRVHAAVSDTPGVLASWNARGMCDPADAERAGIAA
ncbi:MAG: hypothetical protein RIB32_00810 [Phycisphaerales bacterium]